MRYLLTTEQAELMQVVETYRTVMRIKGMISETLGEPVAEIKDPVNLNNLYGLFFNSLKGE